MRLRCVTCQYKYIETESNACHFADIVFIFCFWMKMVARILTKIWRVFVHKDLVESAFNKSALLWIMAWRRICYSNHWWPRLLTRGFVTQPRVLLCPAGPSSKFHCGHCDEPVPCLVFMIYVPASVGKGLGQCLDGKSYAVWEIMSMSFHFAAEELQISGRSGNCHQPR